MYIYIFVVHHIGNICPARDVSNILTLKLNNNENSNNERNRNEKFQKNDKIENLKNNDINDRSTMTSKIHIGIVSGSFDILSGRIIVGLLESIKLSYRYTYCIHICVCVFYMHTRI
jgi:hypothetical protein